MIMKAAVITVFQVMTLWNVCGLWQSSLGFASTTTTTTSTTMPKSPQQKPIPITVLSGFLGSGKTTLLQHLLQNNQGLRIAVIVNDVASINIDSKLIAQTSVNADTPDTPVALTGAPSGMVELQNGCACCSLSEELLGSVSELVMLSDLKGEDEGFHHIVIELSGVADPKSVRAKFQEATLYDMPLMDRVRLDTMVTVIDCSVVLEYMKSGKTATPKDTPELFYRNGIRPQGDDVMQMDWMDDLPGQLLEAILAGGPSSDVSTSIDSGDSGVSELMMAQTETADILLLNKADLASNDRIKQIQQLVAALNPKAKIYETEYGNVDFTKVLAVAGGHGVVEAGVVDDHKDAVSFASHSNECADTLCNHPSHDHSQGHISTHEHSHDHAGADSDSDCGEHSHGHSHDHDACSTPDCTDMTHSHSHQEHAGIGSFVYRARRPFHPLRLVHLLQNMPIVRGLPLASDQEDLNGSTTTTDVTPQTFRALQKVLRGKGFTWLADSNVAALYLSIAGASFDMQCLGRWWSTLPREQWPPEAVASLLADFDDPDHNEDEGDWDTESVGDRRQEIVLIGPGLGDPLDQRSLQEGLDSCLLNDNEWALFRSKRANEEILQTTFANPIKARMVSY